ncbi:hypothetical protein PP707_07670 [Acetobacter pasteurianus]|nr:hypothetical protein [Acetobacter pasteurianus]
MVIAIIECFGVGIVAVVVVGAVAQILYKKGKVTRGGAVYLGSSLVRSCKNHCIYILGGKRHWLQLLAPISSICFQQ